MATLKIKAKGQSYNGLALNKLTIKAKVKHAKRRALPCSTSRSTGGFTEQQEAYIQAMFQKYQDQLPGVVINFKIC